VDEVEIDDNKSSRPVIAATHDVTLETFQTVFLVGKSLHGSPLFDRDDLDAQLAIWASILHMFRHRVTARAWAERRALERLLRRRCAAPHRADEKVLHLIISIVSNATTTPD